MGLKNKSIFFGFEIIFNSIGQILVRKTFIYRLTLKFYRYISKK